ncbi:hypothetical protein DL96DRAFT_784474 [Flagelloscypha sp. PMI_526]|nr:hypothetical protein DL96DRAFT_784474 [Flagelloscypha sp. PMI_526]
MFMVSGFLIAYDDISEAMVVYAQPEIPPKDSYAPAHCAKLNNPALVHIPAEAGMLNRRKVSTMYWNTYPIRGPKISNHDGYASIHDTGEDSWLLERVEICREKHSSATLASLPLKCERSDSRHPYSLPFNNGSRGTADVFIDQSILLHTASRDRTQVTFHLSSSVENNGGAELGRGILYDSEGRFQFGRNDYFLSPFAGRMCLETPDGIEVVDFVELPFEHPTPMI